jgi:hypothetical protein
VHLFMECPVIEQVWALSPMPLLIHNMKGRNISEWVKILVKPEDQLDIHGDEAKEFIICISSTDL